MSNTFFMKQALFIDARECDRVFPGKIFSEAVCEILQKIYIAYKTLLRL